MGDENEKTTLESADIESVGEETPETESTETKTEPEGEATDEPQPGEDGSATDEVETSEEDAEKPKPKRKVSKKKAKASKKTASKVSKKKKVTKASSGGSANSESSRNVKASAAKSSTPETSMIINYVPGEECRVAIVEDGNLEELHVERTDAVSRVNNIYVGKVTNVEAGIQAAFVDFGLEENGFLHISDLHPRYFVEDDATERVGKKTPRRERPPIQQCLKRGQEVIVQVLKEGVGTKGPTLTSYLSIPGRYLVMMPQMDKVGVSRKVDDEDQRSRMKEILGQLDLPDGFGFILRTAGFDKTKTDLKRDLAYLNRLWKNMEATRKKGGKRIRLLYSESDLLVRSLRDLVTPEISRIIIDDEGAVSRAAQFMKIVSPRSTVKVMHYSGGRPIFHAFGIEQQIAVTHSREVPLPSGGRLVIDETEAIVAIDVNSGKSRAAKDAETNAYRTNVEAVEAICRQMRLRDLGGIVINDLIDMRSAKHRKAIEQLFRERLKRDRAKSTTAPISPFGILELTRQRMRGSLRSQHFVDCPTCRGKGLVQRPKSVASDALREVALLLEHDRVDRVELVVGARVAGELLSARRGSLNRIERRTGKQIHVRVSDAQVIDKFTVFAYDANGSDVDAEKLPKTKGPEDELHHIETRVAGDDWAVDAQDEQEVNEEPPPPEPEAPAAHPIEEDFDEEEPEPTKKKRRRRRRRRKGQAAEGVAPEGTSGDGSETGSADASEPVAADPSGEGDEGPVSAEGETGDHDQDERPEGEAPKKKRRRRRRKKSDATDSGESPAADQSSGEETDAIESTSTTDAEGTETPSEDADVGEEGVDEGPTKKRRRRRRRRKSGEGTSDAGEASSSVREEDERAPSIEEVDGSDQDEAPRAKKKRRRSKGSGGSGSSVGEASDVEPAKKVKKTRRKASSSSSVETKPEAPAKKKPRTLYGATRRRIGPSESARPRDD